MHRAASGRRPPADPNSIESKYLMSTVGPALVRGLAEIVERRPNDPIEYLATFLYKQVNNDRARQQKEDEAKQLEIEKVRVEEEKQHRAQLKKEIRALREREANERKEREAEETRKREAEELAKRQKEMAAATPPTLPSVREEDDENHHVEFGETELHRQAATKDADLSQLLHDNYHLIASRNAQGKTPRDVAADAGLQENVDQIDQFCREFLQNKNTKAIQDLILSGYSEIVNQLKPNEENEDEMNDFLTNEIPQLLNKVKELKKAIKDGNLKNVQDLINEKKSLALYRDSDGSSSIHEAIEHQHFDIAVFLIRQYPSLINLKDLRQRTVIDLFNNINEENINDEQRESFDQLKETLNGSSTTTIHDEE